MYIHNRYFTQVKFHLQGVQTSAGECIASDNILLMNIENWVIIVKLVSTTQCARINLQTGEHDYDGVTNMPRKQLEIAGYLEDKHY